MQLDDVTKVFAACMKDASIFDRDDPSGNLFEVERIKKERADWLAIAAGVPESEADNLFPSNSSRADRATIPLRVLGGGQASFFFVLRPLGRLPEDPASFERIAYFSPSDDIPFVEIREAYFRLSNMPGCDNGLNHLRWELDPVTGHQDPMEDWLRLWKRRLGCNPGHPPSHLHFNAPPLDAQSLGGGRSDPSTPELRLAVGMPNPLAMILSIAVWVRRP